MNSIYPIIIFVIVFFCYIHVINEYKVSEDLEVYEMDYSSNSILQEICDIRQPVIFERHNKINFPSLEAFKQTVAIKDLKDYIDNKNSIESIELPCSSFLQLIKNDSSARYLSENNQTFIDESGLEKFFLDLDIELKSNNLVTKRHDIMIASNNVCTPFRYHTDSRRFLYVTRGSLKMKMTSKKFTKYLDEIKDFESLEFRSPIDVWNLDNSKIIDKIQFIEFDIPCGHIIYIPSFWWYSMKFNESDTIVLECRYSSVSNKVAFIFDSFRHYLQEYNIVRGVKRVVVNQSVEVPNVNNE